VTANQGIYNKKTEVLDLTGQIRVNATNGYRATLSSARVTLKNGHISSNQAVIVYMPQGSIAANGVEMLDGGATIRFLNRVRMDIDGSRAK
jgi:lipopolysaccharide export system protein LptC